MITFFNISGAMIYLDEQGRQTGYEDVWTKIDLCRAHYAAWTHREYVEQFIRYPRECADGRRVRRGKSAPRWGLAALGILDVAPPACPAFSSGDTRRQSGRRISRRLCGRLFSCSSRLGAALAAFHRDGIPRRAHDVFDVFRRGDRTPFAWRICDRTSARRHASRRVARADRGGICHFSRARGLKRAGFI